MKLDVALVGAAPDAVEGLVAEAEAFAAELFESRRSLLASDVGPTFVATEACALRGRAEFERLHSCALRVASVHRRVPEVAAYLTEARFRLSVARALRARTDVAASAAVERLEAPLRLPAFAACRRATAELAAAAGSSADRFELALQCDPVGACAAALESAAAASNRERRKCARAGRRALFNLAIINTVP